MVVKTLLAYKSEVARHYGRTRRTIYDWIKKGMPIEEDGTFDLDKIDHWLSHGRYLSDGCLKTKRSVARHYGVSPRTIYTWIKEGMPVEKNGTFNIDRIFFWLQQREIKKKQRPCKSGRKKKERIWKLCVICRRPFLDYENGKRKACSRNCGRVSRTFRTLRRYDCLNCGQIRWCPKSYIRYRKIGKLCDICKNKIHMTKCSICNKKIRRIASIQRLYPNSVCSDKCQREFLSRHFSKPGTYERHKAYARARMKKIRAELYDNYIRNLIVQRTTLKGGDMPQEVVELKRLQIQLKRTLREKGV